MTTAGRSGIDFLTFFRSWPEEGGFFRTHGNDGVPSVLSEVQGRSNPVPTVVKVIRIVCQASEDDYLGEIARFTAGSSLPDMRCDRPAGSTARPKPSARRQSDMDLGLADLA
jgi:hypothetical protein